MIRRPPRSTHCISSAASDVYKRQLTFFLSAQLFRWEPESRIPRRAKLLVAATAIPFLLLGIVENRSDRILLEAKSAFIALTSPMSAPRSDAAGTPSKPGTGEKPSNDEQK